jgi:sulfoacetate-CoA ligase
VIANGGFSAKRFWDEVAVTNCSWLSIVPTVASYLVARATGGVRHRLRFARSASAPLDLSLHREFESRFEVRLFETLGMTEAAGPVLVHPGSGSERLPGETGRPVIEAKVVDSDSGERVAAGDIGALWVSGPSVVDGYWNNPTATQQSFKDGWFVSGDLVRLAPTGMLSFVGRESEMINKGGEKIAPLEIDRVALSYPGVVEAAAFGIPDEHYGTTIGLAIVGEVLDQDGLRAHIRSYLGDYKAPDLVLEVDELPRGPSGKIQRRRLVG